MVPPWVQRAHRERNRQGQRTSCIEHAERAVSLKHEQVEREGGRSDLGKVPVTGFPAKWMGQDFPSSPVVKPSPFNPEGMGSILGWGAKIPHASQPKNQNMQQKQYCVKLNKAF